MTVQEVMAALEAMGSESTRKIFRKHGATCDMFGVKVGDMKKLLKPLKNNQTVAMDLYKTGNSDAMYLAGLVANGALMSKEELQHWASTAPWNMISEYTVPWVTSENNRAMELALEWIESSQESIASSGWSTLSAIVSITPDDKLDLSILTSLLKRVQQNIHQSPNRVRYTMNGFVIAVGSFVSPLTKEALNIAEKTGVVTVNMEGTECKVPAAGDYIEKVIQRGSVGKKKKTVKC